MSSVLVLTDESFDSEIAKAAGPVLVDFWAPWCGPCRAVAPVLDELSGEYEGRAVIAKMNVDENMATPAKFGVRSIPNMVIIKNGAEVGRVVGSQPKANIKKAIDEAF